METREKLIELQRVAILEFLEKKTDVRLIEYIADHLIANGVIVPPCEIGADIWYIDSETITVECEKNGVAGFVVKKDEILIIDKAGSEDHIGSQFCHLTKESAEEALAAMQRGCKYCRDEICVNDCCPMRADYCPVPDTPGICRYEERGGNVG